MKQIYTLFILTLLLSSCSDDIIKLNAPSIQGEVNGGYFHSLDVSAHKTDSGGLIIQGADKGDTLTFRLRSINEGQRYEFGLDDANFASFKVKDTITYSTGLIGNGSLIIEDWSDGEINGSFNFSAKEDADILGKSITFNQGVFFGIEIGDTQVDEGEDDLEEGDNENQDTDQGEDDDTTTNP